MSSSSDRLRAAKIERVPPFNVPAVWPDVQVWIAAAVAHNGGEASVADVRDDCGAGRADLWLVTIAGVPAGAVVTEIQALATRRVMQVLYLGGDRLGEWLHLQDVLATWAAVYGCTAMRIKGRHGWLRRLAAHGWARTAVEMEHAI